MSTTLDESDVGIYCYVSSLPGFRAVLKQRYADFIVNEVDLAGKAVRLSSFDLPPGCSEEEEKSISFGQKSFKDEIELFRALAGEADTELLKKFLQMFATAVDEEIPPIILAPDGDKSHRAEVHNFFKKNFKFVVTDTVDGGDGGSKCIRIRVSSGNGGKGRRGKKRKDMENLGMRDDRPFDSRGSDNWPEEQGKFLRFHLYKVNKDTQEALGVIGKMLGIQQRSFGFAGTKDKRAITTQRVTVFKLHPKRLSALNCRLFGIKIGDFCYVREGLLLGQLLGNRFTISLRDVSANSADIIKAAADGLGRSGFINYYGLQRFGSGSVPTHLIGAALLRGEWKTAVDLILDPRDRERSDIKEAREKYKKSGDADLFLRQLPRHLVAERAIDNCSFIDMESKSVFEFARCFITLVRIKFIKNLNRDFTYSFFHCNCPLFDLIQCLKKFPGNYLQALQGVPRTLRLMYVHSYQSYLWNHAASMRVQKYGIEQVVIGDLVFCKGDTVEKLASFDCVEPKYECDDGEDDNGFPDVLLPEEKIQRVKIINPDDLSKGTYTFEDIVLPLPGSRIIYPDNDISEIFHDLAKKDSISLTESVHAVKEFSISNMTGDYRRVFQRPIDYTWELLSYTNNNEDLAETDLDIISRLKSTDLATDKSSISVSLDEKVNFVSDDKNPMIDQVECHGSDPKVALKLGFTLPASCYATMAIRELLKSSTSVAYQKTMNQ